MPRFFIDQELEQGPFTLTGEDVHHIKNVLRLKPGDRITLCDSTGSDCLAQIERFSPAGLELIIIERKQGQTEPSYQVTLFQGLAKGDKMDAIIQKAVELGVARFVPVRCSRSVTRVLPAEAAKKTARWQRIAESAAKQCGRSRIPEVSLAQDFMQAVAEASAADIRLMPWEGERSCSIRGFLEAAVAAGNLASPELQEPKTSHPAAISVLIGPEGGFTADEVEQARQAGITTVTIGQRILRTETAGAAVLAMLIYQFNEF
jgi:16S rRNA (uracil1498-N3)-methyltransferase